jgi:hypothetical protein
MTWLRRFIGTATGAGVSEAADGIGRAAISIRTAITGDLPPKVKAQLAEIDKDISLAQVELNKLEGQSASFFRAGWRPAVGWLCVFGLAYNALASPLIQGVFGVAMPVTNDSTLTTILFALLGIGTLRTIEKKGRIR